MNNPRPLARLFSSPRELLAKATRDLDRLETAAWNSDLTGCRDAMIDACVAVYHVNDWIRELHPDQANAAKRCMDESDSILMCRDICNADKHFELRLDQHSGHAAQALDHSISATPTFAGLSVLKIRSVQYGDHRANEVVRKAIKAWEDFLDDANIS
jgi:hypothetical protein